LSIIAVDPSLHGRGLGQQLLQPTLMDADANDAISYLETFGLRTTRFYERLGFSTVARFDEPTTGAQYALMVRNPRAAHA
jgi:N-acetylglutamate synthase-like GNAT family acetyltransferase